MLPLLLTGNASVWFSVSPDQNRGCLMREIFLLVPAKNPLEKNKRLITVTSEGSF